MQSARVGVHDANPNPDPDAYPNPDPDANPNPDPDANPTPIPNQAVSWDGSRPAKVSHPNLNPDPSPSPSPSPNPNPNPNPNQVAASGRTASIHLPRPCDDPAIQAIEERCAAATVATYSLTMGRAQHTAYMPIVATHSLRTRVHTMVACRVPSLAAHQGA